MPYTIDEEKMAAKGKGNQSYDLTKPPVKNIPHLDFPKMMYLWPKDKALHPVSDQVTAVDDEGVKRKVTDYSRTSTKRIKIAKDASEEAVLRAKGYRDKPHVQEAPEELPEDFEIDMSHLPNTGISAEESMRRSKRNLGQPA